MSVDSMIDAVIQREGGYVDHPLDAGGPTKYGITQATLAAWSGRSISASDVANMSEDTARAIYRSQYFVQPGFEAVTDPATQELLFDYAVNSGPRAAVAALQEALRQMKLYTGAIDGIIGPMCRQALRAVPNWGELYYRIKCERFEAYLRYIGRRNDQAAFATGWANRMDTLQRSP